MNTKSFSVLERKYPTIILTNIQFTEFLITTQLCEIVTLIIMKLKFK